MTVQPSAEMFSFFNPVQYAFTAFHMEHYSWVSPWTQASHPSGHLYAKNWKSLIPQDSSSAAWSRVDEKPTTAVGAECLKARFMSKTSSFHSEWPPTLVILVTSTQWFTLTVMELLSMNNIIINIDKEFLLVPWINSEYITYMYFQNCTLSLTAWWGGNSKALIMVAHLPNLPSPPKIFTPEHTLNPTGALCTDQPKDLMK